MRARGHTIRKCRENVTTASVFLNFAMKLNLIFMLSKQQSANPDRGISSMCERVYGRSCVRDDDAFTAPPPVFNYYYYYDCY